MNQKYAVYFANRLVIFTQERPDPSAMRVNDVVIESKGKMDILLIESAILQKPRKIYVVCKDVEASWRTFCHHFEQVQSAGGVIVNPEGKILFIFRQGKWDLPKGKVEENETLEQAALREVQEECAIHHIEKTSPLCVTWHTYMQNGDPILKSTAWFRMEYAGDDTPVPQSEEGITEIRWMDLQELNIVKKNTYLSILEVIHTFQYPNGEKE